PWSGPPGPRPPRSRRAWLACRAPGRRISYRRTRSPGNRCLPRLSPAWRVCLGLLFRRGARPAERPPAGPVDAAGRSAFELLPHLDVALVGPDARVVVAGRLVVGARDVERHAVVEDHPLAVARLHEIVDLAV